MRSQTADAECAFYVTQAHPLSSVLLLLVFRLRTDYETPQVIKSFIMRVLVTGGAGYIGSHTLLELMAQGRGRKRRQTCRLL